MSIKLKNIRKTFENQIILDNLVMELPESGVVALWGQSGIGKTTIVNLIIGTEKADFGEITGNDNIKFSVVFQQDRLLDWISAKENILAVNNNDELCDELLKAFGLEADAEKLPTELSGGMRQRIAIARALAYNGDVFVFDEAFKGLDFKHKQDAMGFVKKYIQNKLCIFITHDIDEVVQFADVVYVFDETPVKSYGVLDFKISDTTEEKEQKLKSIIY